MTDERAKLVAALGDLVARNDDDMMLSEPGDDEVPILALEELDRRLPVLDQPMSRSVIDDRADRL